MPHEKYTCIQWISTNESKNETKRKKKFQMPVIIWRNCFLVFHRFQSQPRERQRAFVYFIHVFGNMWSIFTRVWSAHCCNVHFWISQQTASMARAAIPLNYMIFFRQGAQSHKIRKFSKLLLKFLVLIEPCNFTKSSSSSRMSMCLRTTMALLLDSFYLKLFLKSKFMLRMSSTWTKKKLGDERL